MNNRRKGQGMGEPRNSPRRVRGKLKQADAVMLRSQGLTFKEIADRLGYADRATAYIAVDRVLKEIRTEAAEELRLVEHARLNFLISRIWKKIEKGDIGAGALLVRISQRLGDLFGFDLPKRAPVDGDGRPVLPIINVIYESTNNQYPPADTAPGAAADHS